LAKKEEEEDINSWLLAKSTNAEGKIMFEE
jgi:hypothetical protein